MISYEAVQKIIGIKEKVTLTPPEMAKILNITFFPTISSNISPDVLAFVELLKKSLQEIGVNIVPYEEATELMPLKKVVTRAFKILAGNLIYIIKNLFKIDQKNHFVKFETAKRLLQRTRIKRGISVVVIGEQETSKLAMDNIYSFRDNSIITILPFPDSVDISSTFHQHFDLALSLFAFHMTNIILAVDSKKWMVYNFNASHPIYSFDDNFNNHLLNALIPKIVAPISPYKFKDFILLKEQFNPNDTQHKPLTDDLVDGALLFDRTNLYPSGKKIDDLPFRTDFHRFIGKLHLDNRNGMSYGFLARQMPTALQKIWVDDEIEASFKNQINDDKDWFCNNGDTYLILEFYGRRYCLKVPEVWVITQRSGSNKTHVDKDKDLLKMGLKNGQMYIQAPIGVKMNNDYKPSFDTKIILAHAVGNAIVASISSYLNINAKFYLQMKKEGFALAHWHGYLKPDLVPEKIITYGFERPHVACSSPQSGIYALSGKLEAFIRAAENKTEFLGDIHIEPHHGSNVNYPTIIGLAQLLLSTPNLSTLGNEYLSLYESKS